MNDFRNQWRAAIIDTFSKSQHVANGLNFATVFILRNVNHPNASTQFFLHEHEM